MFYENYWKKRAGTKLSDFDLKWPILSKYIPLKEGVIILDFGCGNGKILGAMNDLNPKAKFIGLDVSEFALDEASKNLPMMEFHRIMDGRKFPIRDESVDFIFSSEVIEHIYDTENAFSEIYRILRRGGTLLMTTPYHGRIKNILLALSNFDGHFDPTGPHIRFFTKNSMLSCLSRVGLEVVKWGYFGRFYPVPHCMYIIARKREKVVK